MDLKISKKFKGLLPVLTDEAIALLESQLLADGCREPLSTWQGVLIDGHNRLAICTKHKIPFKTVEINLPDAEAVEDWIDATALARRNMSSDAAALVRGRRYERTKQRHGAESGGRGNQYSVSGQTDHLAKTAETLAAEHGVSEKTIRRDGKRFQFFESLGKKDQEAVMAGDKKLNEVKREARRVEVKETAALPTDKFRVIYADPPWKYGDQLTESYGPTKYQYPTLSIADLCAMPIRGLCQKDAVLFLWVTSPLLDECFAVINAWGFAYKSSFVWDKVKHNMGHYNSVRHEFLLICTRGSCQPDSPKLFDSVQSIERTKHSEKPEEFRKIIQTLYPHGKRIELFARTQHPGWESWGNQ